MLDQVNWLVLEPDLVTISVKKKLKINLKTQYEGQIMQIDFYILI